MTYHCYSRRQIETRPLPRPSAVVCMANPDCGPAKILDAANAVHRLNLAFHDIDESLPNLQCPTAADAERIVKFAAEARTAGIPNFVAQCDAGIGRSQAVVAGLAMLQGQDVSPILANGTYNRLLYRLIVEAGGKTLPPDPLVSIVVRVKYPLDRHAALTLSMERQRYRNWEMVVVSDGEWDFGEPGVYLANMLLDDRMRMISTVARRGLWGHPYRQLGIDAANGEFIGLTNDDNYYTPGYIEQMVFVLQHQQADLAVCAMSHAYSGWGALQPSPSDSASTDIGCWLARTELVRQTPWSGNEFTSDGDYFAALHQRSRKTVVVPKVLFVKN